MITKEHIDDLGKEAYAKWRKEKTTTNYLKAQNKVPLTDHLYDTYDDTGEYEEDTSPSLYKWTPSSGPAPFVDTRTPKEKAADKKRYEEEQKAELDYVTSLSPAEQIKYNKDKIREQWESQGYVRDEKNNTYVKPKPITLY